jgi:hypothetical protein
VGRSDKLFAVAGGLNAEKLSTGTCHMCCDVSLFYSERRILTCAIGIIGARVTKWACIFSYFYLIKVTTSKNRLFNDAVSK